MGAKKEAVASPKAAAARPRRAAASPAAPGPSPAGTRKPAKKADADAGPVLDRKTVAALTREIGQGLISDGGGFDADAIEALREAAEAHVTSIFEHARAAAAAAGREELTLDDVRGVTAAMAKALEEKVKTAAK